MPSYQMEYGNYEKALLPALRKIAKKEGMIGYSTMKKDKLREALRTHFTLGDVHNMYTVKKLKELCKYRNINKIPSKKADIIFILERDAPDGAENEQVLPDEIFALIAHYSLHNNNTETYDSICRLTRSIHRWIKIKI